MKTRKFFMIVMLVFLSGLSVQGQNWEWAKNPVDSSGGDSGGERICTDLSGNVYVIGSYSWGKYTFGNTTFIGSGAFNLFLVKYDSTGNVIWAKNAGNLGSSYQNQYSLSIDPLDNVYITGYFTSIAAHFGAFTLLNNSTNNSDFFLAKYDSSGNVLWAKSVSGECDISPSAIAVDKFGNSYITGSFTNDSIRFGSTTIYNYTIDTNEIFFVKYDSAGNAIWATSFGGHNYGFGYDVNVDSTGNVFLLGNVIDTINLGNNATLIPGNFVAKFDSSGNAIWTKRTRSETSMSRDALGNLYLMGTWLGSSFIIETDTFINNGLEATYIVKYDSSGNKIWAKYAQGYSNTDEINGEQISTDASGNSYITGYIDSDSINFYSNVIGYGNSGNHVLFLVKYDSSGNALWEKSLGINQYHERDGNGVSADAFGNVYVTGYFQTDLPFGLIILNCNGDGDMFIAKNGSEETGISEIKHQQPISILLSPNPFTTQTILTLQGSYTNPTLFIYNLLGQEVRSIKVGTNTQLTINREQLAGGMYFYKVIDENNNILGIGKLIAE